MAKKEISVLIKARNMMAAGLASAGSALQRFGQTAANVGRFFAKSFLAAGVAIAGLGLKAVQAFSVQEAAEKQAASAFLAYGEEVENNVANVKRFAAAIQDETGASDESTIATAAKLKLLGVETQNLEQATKATIALAAAGMGEEQATKAVAGAMVGEFTALQRYLPALKVATTEAEKAQIVNDFLTKGYAQQKDKLNTVAGQWGALKGRIGDSLEVIGSAISQNGALAGMLNRAGEAVKSMGQKIEQWINSGGLQNAIHTFKLFGSNVQEQMTRVSAYVHYGLTEAFEGVKWFGSSTQTVFRNAGKIIESTWLNTTNTIGYHLAKLHAKVTGQEWNIEPPKMVDILDGLDALPQKSGAAAAELFRQLSQIEAESAKRTQAITANFVKATNKKKVVQEEVAADAVKDEDKIVVAKVNAIKMLEEEIKLAQKKAQIHAEVAKKTIADILAEQKAREDASKSWEKDEKKAAELRGRMQRGAKLSKQDQKWLEAFGQIETAKGGIKAGVDVLENAMKQLEQMKDQNLKLGDIKDELTKVHKDLNEILQRT